MCGSSRPWSHCPHAQRHQERTLPQAVHTAARNATCQHHLFTGASSPPLVADAAPPATQQAGEPAACWLPPYPDPAQHLPALGHAHQQCAAGLFRGPAWRAQPPRNGPMPSAAACALSAPISMILSRPEQVRDHGRPHQHRAPARPGKHPMSSRAALLALAERERVHGRAHQ